MTRVKLLTLSASLLLSLALIGMFKSSASNTKQGKRAPLTVLQSSEKLLDTEYSKRPMLAPSKDGQNVYALDSMTGELSVYERKGKNVRKAPPLPMNVEAFAIGSEDKLYLGTPDSSVHILDSSGRQLNQFSTVYPRSIAALDNGNVVVASPSSGKLLHLYSPTGLLLGSFGDMKNFDGSPMENEFLNRGKVIVGLSNEIFYISMYAPAPYVLKFSQRGDLLAEFSIEGDAVNFQISLLKNFLSERKIDQTGGFTIITSASVDPATGHLWIGMNGLSSTSTIYEYDPTGTKIREYAFLINTPTRGKRNVTHLKDIVAGSSTLSILTWDGSYSFKLSDIVIPDAYAVAVKNSSSAKTSWLDHLNPFSLIKKLREPEPTIVPAIPQPEFACGEAQGYSCTANCPSGSLPTTVDCGAQISARLRTGDVVTSSSCTAKPIDATPGSSAPGGCTETATFCNTGDGTTGTTTVTVNCNPVPTPTPTPVPTPEPTPTPTAGLCGGAPDYGTYPSGCASGFTVVDGICDRSNQFKSRCYGQGYDPESCTCPDGQGNSPILIDIDHSGFSLTDAANGVDFDITALGYKQRVAWTQSGSTNAWLVLDRNGNSVVDDSTELFGNYTAQMQSNNPNGFIALSMFDRTENGGNNDGVIDNRDSIYTSLRLWQDANHNGISEASELHTLPELGVAELELDYKESKRTDQYGNQFRYRAKVKDARGAQVGRWAWDVFLTAR